MTVAASIPDHLTRLDIVREFEAPAPCSGRCGPTRPMSGCGLRLSISPPPWSGWTCGPAEPFTW